MILADETTQDGSGSASGYTTTASQPRTAQPRNGGGSSGGSGATQIGGHTVGGSSGSGSGGTSSETETVSQAYLAALAAMGKNTSGDTSPYVIMSPGAGTGGGSSIGLGTVLIIAALGLGAWWYMKHRKGE